MSDAFCFCRFAGACLLFVAPAPASLAAICDEPDTRPYVAIEAIDHDRAAIDPGPGETAQLNQNLRIHAKGPGELMFGFSHRYTKFNFDGIEPQTNAHLHTSTFPVHWIRNISSGEFRAGIAPALSASSNVMGHPQRYRSDTLQAGFALVWQRRLSERLSARYGLCGDHRFGNYRVYPTVGATWRPYPDWNLDLGFPTSRISYGITKTLTTSLRIAPDGNEWHVMNRNFDAESHFVYESWALEWVLRLNAGEHLSISASLGRQLRNRFEMTLINGERVDLSGDSAGRVGAALRWRF